MAGHGKRVLVTGHDGYIGTVMVPMLQAAGYEVTGLDTHLFGGDRCLLGSDNPGPAVVRCDDIRDVGAEVLAEHYAVVHLAGISNDPLGDLDPQTTAQVNRHATTNLALAAKAAGVERFLFSSSCSLYGAQGDGFLDESASFHPVTPYGHSKIDAENDLRALADASFSPTYLRNSTAYGLSPRLRGDLVVNNLTGYAVATGQVFLKSDGTSWRPLVHIEDISRAFVACLDAPQSLVHNEAFNVGATEENYRIRDVADIVGDIVPGSTVTLSDTAFDDPRNYRVNCDKLARVLPAAVPQWTVQKGVEELWRTFMAEGITVEDLEGERFSRIGQIMALQQRHALDRQMRWVSDRVMV